MKKGHEMKIKEQFRIGKLAQELGVKRFVIRFWEKEFGISAVRSIGGQRFYQPQDFDKFKRIKQLLYEQGFTIAGARKILDDSEKNAFSANIQIKTARQKKSLYSHDIKKIIEQLYALQKHLIKLNNLL